MGDNQPTYQLEKEQQERVMSTYLERLDLKKIEDNFSTVEEVLWRTKNLIFGSKFYLLGEWERLIKLKESNFFTAHNSSRSRLGPRDREWSSQQCVATAFLAIARDQDFVHRDREVLFTRSR